MKKLTQVLIAGIAVVGSALQSDTVQHYFAAAIVPLAAHHPGLSAALVSIAAILALVHNPQKTQ